MSALRPALLCGLVGLLWTSPAPATPPACCSADGQMTATSCGASNEDNDDDTAGLNLALSCPSPQGTPVIYFPAGRYILSGSVVSTLDRQALIFAPNALLVVRGAGGLTVAGARSRVERLIVQLDTASAATFNAIDIAGPGSIVEGVRLDITADVPGATLLRISGERAHVRDVQIIGTGHPFARGVDLRRSDGGEVNYVSVDGIDAALGDSGVLVTYGPLLTLRAQRSQVRDLAYEGGGRESFPSGVVVVAGHRNVLENPHVAASMAQYGIHVDDGAEFFEIVGGHLLGRNNGTFVAGSEGIYSGHFAGHLKLLGTAISGWESGVVFHGSHDTPVFVGAVIANNGAQAILIDSHRAEGDFPVSGLTLVGMYSEPVGGQPTVIHAKSGALAGGVLLGSYVGYTGRVLTVDQTFGGLTFLLDANRLVGVGADAVIDAHWASRIIFGAGNELLGTYTVGGVHPEKIVSVATTP